MSCTKCKKKNCTCEKGDPGIIGLTGPQGAQGLNGLPPAHEWNGTQIRFQNPDGSWGPWVNLLGPTAPCSVGPVGPQGIQGVPGGGGIIGPVGPVGPAGSNGANGISVVGANIDINGDLIITLSDGSTINAGSVTTPVSGSGSVGFNQPGYLFKATNTTAQAHTGGTIAGTILNLAKDSGDDYYDYGDSWSGNDWVLETGPQTLRFAFDQIEIENTGALATGTAINVNIQHVPFVGAPVVIGTAAVGAGLAPASTAIVSAQSTDVVFATGDKVRIVILSAGAGADEVTINPGAEFWNIQV